MLAEPTYNNTQEMPGRRKLGDEVADRLRAEILSGRRPAGEQLREVTLAQAMRVSRGPVREALAQLEREGLVISRRNHSAQVARLSRADLEEIQSLRQALGRLMVREVVRHATAKDLAELQGILDEMSERSKADVSEQEAAELDVRFHDALCRASRHRRLYDIWISLRPQVHMLLLWHKVADSEFRQKLADSHRVLFQAIRDRDESRALALFEEHLCTTYEQVAAEAPVQDE
jgi:DNA-binding GntR family transcriptional regulator